MVAIAGVEGSPTLPMSGATRPERSLVVVEAMVWMKSLRNATAQVVVAFERDGTTYSSQTLTVQDVARRARAWFPVWTHRIRAA